MTITDEDIAMVNGGTKIPYTVAPNDTLTALAAKFNCTVEQICKWNNIDNPNMLTVGQKLIIKF